MKSSPGVNTMLILVIEVNQEHNGKRRSISVLLVLLFRKNHLPYLLEWSLQDV
jgi:hypothetical protein